MARYIDAEEFCGAIMEWGEKRGNQVLANNLCDCVNVMPPADVVPKSEADALHHLLKDAWKRIEELDNLCGKLQKAKDEFASEIFEEIESLHLHITNEFDMRRYSELKKKYTEGEQKSCENCTYYDDYRKDQPCCSCNDCSNWEREEKEQ